MFRTLGKSLQLENLELLPEMEVPVEEEEEEDLDTSASESHDEF